MSGHQAGVKHPMMGTSTVVLEATLFGPVRISEKMKDILRLKYSASECERTPTVHDQPETSSRQERIGAGFGVGWTFRFQAPVRPLEAPRPGHVLMSGLALLQQGKDAPITPLQRRRRRASTACP